MSERINPNEYQPQRELLQDLLAPAPTVIGIEGGPCSGKTTLIDSLQARAEHNDRPLVVLPEAATEHLMRLQEAGINFADLITQDREGFLTVEKDILRSIHDSITEARQTYAGTDAIIVADRCDIGAYLSKHEYDQLLNELGYGQPPLMELVDQLYFLPSVARESRARYEAVAQGNAARYEDYEQAVRTCQANLEAVAGHPELHVAWGGDFAQKITRLTSDILQPEREAEIKLEVSDIEAESVLQAAVERNDMLSLAQLQQSYHQLDGQEFRVRALVGTDVVQQYFLTVKEDDGAFRKELQRRLDQNEYELLRQTPQSGNTLVKVRYSFLEPEADGKKRLWYADKYSQPALPVWHFETDVQNAAEMSALESRHAGTRRRLDQDAKTLIFI